LRNIVALCVLLAFFSPTTAADLSEGRAWVIGPVARFPDEPLGLSVMQFHPTRLGYYFDAKRGLGVVGRDKYRDDISVDLAESWGDPRTDSGSNSMTIDFGLTRVVHSRVGAYIGAGLTWTTTLHEYYDATHVVTEDGRYWVHGGDERGPNLMAGVVLIAGSVWGIQLGAEIPDFGVTAGVFLWGHY
jgi:hypothetical protein